MDDHAKALVQHCRQERTIQPDQIDLPLQALKPGLYVCQVNVIDDVAGSFSFPRFPIFVREPTTVPTEWLNERPIRIG